MPSVFASSSVPTRSSAARNAVSIWALVALAFSSTAPKLAIASRPKSVNFAFVRSADTPSRSIAANRVVSRIVAACAGAVLN